VEPEALASSVRTLPSVTFQTGPGAGDKSASGRRGHGHQGPSLATRARLRRRTAWRRRRPATRARICANSLSRIARSDRRGRICSLPSHACRAAAILVTNERVAVSRGAKDSDPCRGLPVISCKVATDLTVRESPRLGLGGLAGICAGHGDGHRGGSRSSMGPWVFVPGGFDAPDWSCWQRSSLWP
jgi:hypothetical protein